MALAAEGAAMRVGFIGLGDQGGPMARAVAEAGHDLSVWARRPASLEEVAGVPHKVWPTVADVARASDVVGLCVRSDADVEDVLFGQGLLDALAPGSVVVNHGTGSVEVAASLAAKACEKGIALLDAPVSGGREGALDKTLTVMVGGDRDVFERCRPVFEVFGRLVAYLGPPGSGQLAKLVNNLVLTANMKNVADALALGEALDLDVERLVELLLVSSGSSFALRAVHELIPVKDALHHQAMLRKDVGLFGEAARARGVPRSSLEDTAAGGVEALPDTVRRAHTAG